MAAVGLGLYGRVPADGYKKISIFDRVSKSAEECRLTADVGRESMRLQRNRRNWSVDELSGRG